MSVKTIWQCDGCEKEIVMKGQPSDWRKITVMLDGFRGYPVSEHSNGRWDYELCPACQRHLNESAKPTSWPRVIEAKGEPA